MKRNESPMPNKQILQNKPNQDQINQNQTSHRISENITIADLNPDLQKTLENQDKADMVLNQQGQMQKNRSRNSKVESYAWEVGKDHLQQENEDKERLLIKKEKKMKKKKLLRNLRHKKESVGSKFRGLIDNFTKQSEVLQMLMIVQISKKKKVIRFQFEKI